MAFAVSALACAKNGLSSCQLARNEAIGGHWHTPEQFRELRGTFLTWLGAPIEPIRNAHATGVFLDMSHCSRAYTAFRNPVLKIARTKRRDGGTHSLFSPRLSFPLRLARSDEQNKLCVYNTVKRVLHDRIEADVWFVWFFHFYRVWWVNMDAGITGSNLCIWAFLFHNWNWQIRKEVSY